jgi:hypothetical protein
MCLHSLVSIFWWAYALGGGGGALTDVTVYVLWLCLIAIIYIYLWTFVGVQSAFGGGEWCKVLIRGVSTNKIFYFCSF